MITRSPALSAAARSISASCARPTSSSVWIISGLIRCCGQRPGSVVPLIVPLFNHNPVLLWRLLEAGCRTTVDTLDASFLFARWKLARKHRDWFYHLASSYGLLP